MGKAFVLLLMANDEGNVDVIVIALTECFKPLYDFPFYIKRLFYLNCPRGKPNLLARMVMIVRVYPKIRQIAWNDKVCVAVFSFYNHHRKNCIITSSAKNIYQKT